VAALPEAERTALARQFWTAFGSLAADLLLDGVQGSWDRPEPGEGETIITLFFREAS
jgi:hypothetical protein